MCIVIDTCAMHLVFSGSNGDYLPVRDWLVNGHGKMIVGGTTFYKELAKLKRYTGIIAELSRQRKVVRIDSLVVDEAEKRVKALAPKKDFDDPHLIALIDESGCKVLCTEDIRSDSYVKNKKFYVKSRRPSIYRSRGHAHLLCDESIVAVCR